MACKLDQVDINILLSGINRNTILIDTNYGRVEVAWNSDVCVSCRDEGSVYVIGGVADTILRGVSSNSKRARAYAVKDVGSRNRCSLCNIGCESIITDELDLVMKLAIRLKVVHDVLIVYIMKHFNNIEYFGVGDPLFESYPMEEWMIAEKPRISLRDPECIIPVIIVEGNVNKIKNILKELGINVKYIDDGKDRIVIFDDAEAGYGR